MTIAMGNRKDMEKAIDTLNEIKESIINAYAKKTGLRRNKISELMENETWMNAKKAVELGFADEVMFDKKSEPDTAGEESDEKEIEAVWQPYSTKIMGQRVLNRIVSACETQPVADEESDEAACDETDVEQTETGVEVTDKKDDPLAPKKEPEEESEEEESEDEPDKDEPDKDEPDEDESEEDEPEKPKPKTNESPHDETYIMIGPDGRTENGSMPYELLKKQLELLK